ncbi:unnamed protein product [Linum trigynum]|uniref:Uncharacterized protein n=1 Tax=Linum trigynum TaxID=586398 RepID=A0AAV2DB77_9ROSI
MRDEWSNKDADPEDLKLLQMYGIYPTLEEMEQAFKVIDVIRRIKSEPPRRFNGSSKDEGPKQLLENAHIIEEHPEVDKRHFSEMHEGFGETKEHKWLMEHDDFVDHGEKEDHLNANSLDEEEDG